VVAGGGAAMAGVGGGREFGAVAFALVAITSTKANAAGSERITATDFLRSTANAES
jgi:hypothetical protein